MEKTICHSLILKPAPLTLVCLHSYLQQLKKLTTTLSKKYNVRLIADQYNKVSKQLIELQLKHIKAKDYNESLLKINRQIKSKAKKKQICEMQSQISKEKQKIKQIQQIIKFNEEKAKEKNKMMKEDMQFMKRLRETTIQMKKKIDWYQKGKEKQIIKENIESKIKVINIQKKYLVSTIQQKRKQIVCQLQRSKETKDCIDRLNSKNAQIKKKLKDAQYKNELLQHNVEDFNYNTQKAQNRLEKEVRQAYKEKEKSTDLAQTNYQLKAKLKVIRDKLSKIKKKNQKLMQAKAEAIQDRQQLVDNFSNCKLSAQLQIQHAKKLLMNF